MCSVLSWFKGNTMFFSFLSLVSCLCCQCLFVTFIEIKHPAPPLCAQWGEWMVQGLSLTRPRIVAVPLLQVDMGQRQCEAAAAAYSQTRLHKTGGMVKIPSTGWHTASVYEATALLWKAGSVITMNWDFVLDTWLPICYAVQWMLYLMLPVHLPCPYCDLVSNMHYF